MDKEELEKAKQVEKQLQGNEENIYPVLRPKDFPKENEEGKTFITDEHTAESLIYYALDLGKAFVLIDEWMLSQAEFSKEQLREIAFQNVRRLDTIPKKEEFQGNIFYFISRQDGYAASRILNEKYLIQMRKRIKGDMVIAIPHQDVCVVADIRNDKGYRIVSQLNMDFWAKGELPISPLPFAFTFKKKLEPIMIINS